jgi:hypothetical protein
MAAKKGIWAKHRFYIIHNSYFINSDSQKCTGMCRISLHTKYHILHNNAIKQNTKYIFVTVKMIMFVSFTKRENGL